MDKIFTTEVSFSNLEEELGAIITNFDISLFKQVRWFQQKGSQIQQVEIEDYSQVKLHSTTDLIFLMILNFHIKDKIEAKDLTEKYYFPLLISKDKKQTTPWLLIQGQGYQAYVYDGVNELNYVRVIEEFMKNNQKLISKQGGFFSGQWVADRELSFTHQLTDVSSNSITFVNKDEIIKTFRRLQKGVNPELEISLRLQEETEFNQFPELKGYITYQNKSEQRYSVALVQQFIENEGDLWAYTQDYLQDLFTVYDQAENEKQQVNKLIKEYQDLTAQAGETVGNLHRSLAAIDKESFTPRLPKEQELDQWYQELNSNFQLLLEHLKQRKSELTDQKELIDFLLAREQDIQAAVESIFSLRNELGKFIRCHGDLHLEQLLKTKNQIIILDFEGEPLKSIEERRRKYSPLKDIAGMLRSYNYAGYAGYFNYLGQAENNEQLLTIIETWEEKVTTSFLNHYLQTVRQGQEVDFLPVSKFFTYALALFKLEKALYEALYEVKNRPNWLPIPLEGIVDCLKNLN